MNGWQVMAAPLAVVVQVGALVAAAVAAVWLARRLTRQANPPIVVSRPQPVSDSAVVAAYDRALLDGWPPGELATFIEVGRRSGTSGEHVRSVIARRWAA